MKFKDRLLDRYNKFKESNPFVSKAIDLVTSKTFTRTASICALIFTLGLAVGLTGGGAAVVLAAAGLGATVAATIIGVGFQVKTLRSLNKLQERRDLLSKVIELDKILDTKLGKKLYVNLEESTKTYAKNPPNLIKSTAKNLKENIAEYALPIAISAISMNIPSLVISILGAGIGGVFETKEKHDFENSKWKIKQDIDKFNKSVGNNDLKDLRKEVKIKQAIVEFVKSNPNASKEDLSKKIQEETFKQDNAKESKFTYVKNLFRDIANVINPFSKSLKNVNVSNVVHPLELQNEQRQFEDIAKHAANVMKSLKKQNVKIQDSDITSHAPRNGKVSHPKGQKLH